MSISSFTANFSSKRYSSKTTARLAVIITISVLKNNDPHESFLSGTARLNVPLLIATILAFTVRPTHALPCTAGWWEFSGLSWLPPASVLHSRGYSKYQLVDCFIGANLRRYADFQQRQEGSGLQWRQEETACAFWLWTGMDCTLPDIFFLDCIYGFCLVIYWCYEIEMLLFSNARIYTVPLVIGFLNFLSPSKRKWILDSLCCCREMLRTLVRCVYLAHSCKKIMHTPPVDGSTKLIMAISVTWHMNTYFLVCNLCYLHDFRTKIIE